MMQNPEQQRLYDSIDDPVIPPWRKWGAYLSERAWGTVREDYSSNGDAWRYFPHDFARSKACRWGEDGLAGWSDCYQTFAFALALWNGKDPILKERLFGLAPYEGNHGEDVKECYFYLDGTPTHSYMKYLYKYPQNTFPYDDLIAENKRRTTKDREYELLDTGIFKENCYFDVFIEYAKLTADDVCIKIEIANRSSEPACLHVLPQIWFRNRWSWTQELQNVPTITLGEKQNTHTSLVLDSSRLGPPDWLSFNYHLPTYYLYGDVPTEMLFTNNESNDERIWGNVSNKTLYVKDAFHRYVIRGEKCINPDQEGTKACFYYKAIQIPPLSSHTIHLRLSPDKLAKPLDQVNATIALRKSEADLFFASIQEKIPSLEEKQIHRQALAGLFWTTQFYIYDVKKWLEGDNPNSSPPTSRYGIRNSHWTNLHAHHLITMPDKWEYPWFASWDTAFHSVILSLADLPFAKRQLSLFLHHEYQHPNGQIPAYEWAFSDANPPVQAWALWDIYQREKKVNKRGDLTFLEMNFLKLMQNFSWWVNKVDRVGNDVFEGGFLGLDNISIIDRSKPLPGGGHIEQSDGTGWMGFFSILMLRIALELSLKNPLFERLAIVYFEHFLGIASAMKATKCRAIDLWDSQDNFFYDVVSYPDGSHQRLKVRSFVGLIPFFCLDSFEEEYLQSFSIFYKHFKLYTQHYREQADRCLTYYSYQGKKKYLFSLLSIDMMQKVLERTWNSEEFLSQNGLRSLSKYHEKNPVLFNGKSVSYEPGESLEKIKGGNSNWRGPIWFPTNFLFLKSLERLKSAIGDDFHITVNGNTYVLTDLSSTLRNRLIALFCKNSDGIRPVHGDSVIFQQDSYWKDLLLFYEHYHGDNGRGLGAAHQTGWSGLVANLIAEPEVNP